MDEEFVQIVKIIDFMYCKFESYFPTDGNVFILAESFDKLSRIAVRFGIQKLRDDGYIGEMKNETMEEYCLRVSKLHSAMGDQLDNKKGLSFKLNLDKFKKLIEKVNENAKVNSANKLEFNPLNGVFICGRNIYRMESKIKIEFIKKLWEEREIKPTGNNKQIIKQGKVFPKNALAVQIGIIDYADKFDNTAKKILKEEQTQLNRNFKKKNFPIKIRSVGNGYLLSEWQ